MFDRLLRARISAGSSAAASATMRSRVRWSVEQAEQRNDQVDQRSAHDQVAAPDDHVLDIAVHQVAREPGVVPRKQPARRIVMPLGERQVEVGELADEKNEAQRSEEDQRGADQPVVERWRA
ncbi:MAG: hypothetical protein QM739_01560 [Propionivibrio sp.]